MFILKKIVTPFLLPPGLLILFFTLLGIWLMRGKHTHIAWGCISMAIWVWLPSIEPTADLLMKPLESNYMIPDDPKADVIIMLGGGAIAKAPDFSGSGTPSPSTLERMVTAARLQRRFNIPIILSGGKVFSSGASSAQLAHRFLLDLGIPKDAIIIEDKSRDTYENALLSKKICQQKGFSKPLLVTSGYHLKRALIAFKKAELTVTPFPCGLTTWPNKTYYWYNFLPSASALLNTSAAWHEWLGLLYYRFAY